MGIREAFQAHLAELDAALTPDRRRQALLAWRQAVDSGAQDYADLVAAHPRRDEILRAEGEVIMNAWLCGYMAQRGWIRDVDAKQAAFTLGRMLRDRLRAMGVSVDSCKATLGATIEGSLGAIVALGLKNA